MYLLILLSLIVNLTAAFTGWQEIASSTPLGARELGSAAYCPSLDSMVIFGGARYLGSTTSIEFNSVWDFSFTAGNWTKLNPNQSPHSRQSPTLTTLGDSAQNSCQFVLIAGTTSFPSNLLFPDFNDVWLLTITSNGTTTWEQLNTSNGIAPRSAHTAIYRRGKIYLFGGVHTIVDTNGNTNFEVFNDLWELTIGTLNSNGTRPQSIWTQYTQLNSSSYWPSPRYYHTMAFLEGATSNEDQFIVYGGFR